MANDEGLPSASPKETLRSFSPDDALTSNEAVQNVEKKSSLCPDVEVAARSMSIPRQSPEAKSDDDDETTVIKLFGVLIEAKKPKTRESSEKVIPGSFSTSTNSRNGKEIKSSTTVIINNESPQYYSKKRKVSVPMEQNAERRQQEQRPCFLPARPQRPADEVPGSIRKTLTKSDVDQSSRLLIGKQDMVAHVLPYLTEDLIAMTLTVQGLPVRVWDVDNGGFHHLVLKQWRTGSFVLTGNWIPQFVQRKNLKVGDTIELLWHRLTSVFLFRVSARSNGTEASSSKADHSGGKEK